MGVIVNWRSFSCKEKEGESRGYCFQEKKDKCIQVKSCSSFSVVINDRIGVFCQKLLLIWFVLVWFDSILFDLIECIASLVKTKLGLYPLNSLEVNVMIVDITFNFYVSCFLSKRR